MNEEETTLDSEIVEPVPDTADNTQSLPDDIDYTGSYDEQMLELLTSIDGRLEELLSYFGLINDAVRVIPSYGLIWVPLIIVVTMLWWFFSQFLHKY